MSAPLRSALKNEESTIIGSPKGPVRLVQRSLL